MNRTIHKILIASFIFLSSLALIVYPTQEADAAWNASYIITDNEFTASYTMPEADIQNFLAAKGNYLENYTVPAARSVVWNGVSYYESPWIGPFGAEVNATGWKASKVIYNVANWYNINPQVVLATIQKESSLVTTAPAYYGLVQWAMGYAYTDSGIRDACNSGTNNNPTGSCAGFAMQVDWGAGMLGYWGNSGGYYNYPVGTTKNICYTDGSTSCSLTYIGNAATSVLYAYTPYFHGNMNFSYFYNYWFHYGEYLQSSISASALTISNTTPARGETIDVSFSFTNNLESEVTVEKVGVIGRLNSTTSGINRDLVGQADVTFLAGETKNFSFSTVVKDTGDLYFWPYFKYDGSFYQYNIGAKKLTAHVPDLIITVSMAISNPPSPILGSTPDITTTVKNNEPNSVYLENLMIGARYEDVWNRDTARTGTTTLSAGESRVLAGNISFNKTGDFKTWPVYKQNGYWYSINSSKIYQVAPVTKDSFPMSLQINSRRYPALGERSLATVSITNPKNYGVTLQSVGIAARAVSPKSPYNRDYGSQQDVVIAAGQTWIKTFETQIKDISDIYLWPYFKFNNTFYSEGIWDNKITSHVPHLTVTTPINVTNAVKGQTGVITATIRNDEPYALYLDSVGFMVRFYGVYNRDTGFVSGTIYSGDTKVLTGSINFTKSGPYSAWVAYKENGNMGKINSSLWEVGIE